MLRNLMLSAAALALVAGPLALSASAASLTTHTNSFSGATFGGVSLGQSRNHPQSPPPAPPSSGVLSEKLANVAGNTSSSSGSGSGSGSNPCPCTEKRVGP